MFCSREESTYHLMLQQNEKSKQNLHLTQHIHFPITESIILTNLVEAWYSLEQYIGLKEDKLSSTTVDLIRSPDEVHSSG